MKHKANKFLSFILAAVMLTGMVMAMPTTANAVSAEREYTLTSDEQYAANTFLSRFSEQNAFSSGFDVNNWNIK